MQFFRRHRTLLLVLLFLVLVGGGFLLFKKDAPPEWTTGTVTRGNVEELISVSGVLESSSNAKLSFSGVGIVDKIYVTEGSEVKEGDVLAELELGELLADKRDAEGALIIARANQSELLAGPRAEARDVTASQIQIAKTNLAQTKEEGAQKIENAYRTLLSSDLEALPTDPNTEAMPPTVSGTYTCGKEGAYTVSLFRSGSQSGYSYRLSGLEIGTYTAYTDAPAPLGTCGLFILFGEGEPYGSKTFIVSVPNTRSDAYAANLNAYLLTKEQGANAIRAAEEALMKAEREGMLANALPRDEERARANATVLQTQARLEAIDARIRERTLIAPFSGTVSDVDLTRGEVSTGRSVTLVASSLYELTIRIPEIDITDVLEGQSARVTFDARPEESVATTIAFISKSATEIDGVAYFEAKLRFENPPTWFRSGLNADVDIKVSGVEDTLRVPKRFITEEDGQSYLLYPEGVETRKEKVEILFTGNDGFVAVRGNIRENDTIVAP